jgi:hypothetical protein
MVNPNVDESGSSRTYPSQEKGVKCCRSARGSWEICQANSRQFEPVCRLCEMVIAVLCGVFAVLFSLYGNQVVK